MFPALSLPARRFAALIALIAVASVIGHFMYLNDLRNETALETVWSMLRFFTILTTLLVAVTWGLASVERDGVSAPWLASLTVAIVMVGGVYHALLRGIVEYQGIGLWADHGLHTVGPIACVLWWLAFAPKAGLSFRHLPMFALWPVIYVIYAVIRGLIDGTYPYPFMNLNELSILAVAINLFGLVVVLMLAGAVMVLIARFTER